MDENIATMNRAIELAEKWQIRAEEKITDFEKKFHDKMKKMLLETFR